MQASPAIQVGFGGNNRGNQIGVNYGPIHAPPIPPGKFASVANRPSADDFPHQERPETPPSPSLLIPFPQDPDFVERGVIFDQINQKCAVPGSRTALVGLGGVG